MSWKSETLFHESGLDFRFDNRWIIRKYDEHTYYRGLSSAGLKAVDFIGIYQDTRAVFIEVKNYGQRSPKKAEEILLDPDPFIERMLKKITDTRIGIRAIHGYFSRNWIYRLLYPRLINLPLRNWNRASWVFWAQLYHRVCEKQELEVIFCLEFLDSYEGVPHEVQKAAIHKITTVLMQGSEAGKQQVRVLINLMDKDSSESFFNPF
ncbi:MAG: hypothetical protein KDC34_06355 [Saprospiraceae bacterium]|nr:hypothetical protein [Saprospiraceae bacterium]